MNASAFLRFFVALRGAGSRDLWGKRVSFFFFLWPYSLYILAVAHTLLFLFVSDHGAMLKSSESALIS